MQYPNIKYIITSQLFEKTKYYELLIAIPNENEDSDSEAIIITTPVNLGKDSNKNEPDGSNIKFTKSTLEVGDTQTYSFDELTIIFEDGKCYLVLESNNNKLWRLPNQVISFLKMDQVKTDYALTIVDKFPHIIEFETRNTCGQNKKLNLKRKLTLAKSSDGGLYSEGEKISDVSFHYICSDSLKDSLNKSYFMKYNSKYYLAECYLHKQENKIGVYADLKINNTRHENGASLLGFIMQLRPRGSEV